LRAEEQNDVGDQALIGHARGENLKRRAERQERVVLIVAGDRTGGVAVAVGIRRALMTTLREDSVTKPLPD
jgi:hypothetical protein